MKKMEKCRMLAMKKAILFVVLLFVPGYAVNTVSVAWATSLPAPALQATVNR